MFSIPIRLPALLLVATALLVAAAVFGATASQTIGTAVAAPSAQATSGDPDPGAPPPTPEPTLERPTPEPTPPANSTLPDPGEAVTVTTSWGTLGAEPVELDPASTTLPFLGRDTRDSGGQERHPRPLTSHAGKAKVFWKAETFLSGNPDAILHYRIERRYYFPGGFGPSRFEVLAWRHPHDANAEDGEQVFYDSDVPPRSVFEYRVTPVLPGDTLLDAGVARIRSTTSNRLEAYAVTDTSIRVHFRNNDDYRPSANHLAAMRRIVISSSGGRRIGGTFNWTLTPPQTHMTWLDTGVESGSYYSYVGQLRHIGENAPASADFLFTGVPVVKADAGLPSEPRNLAVTGEVGSTLRVSWDAPTTKNYRVAHYEILRRSLTPVGPFEVVGTSKDRRQASRGTESDRAYEFKVRAVTQSDQRGPESDSVILGPTPMPTFDCNTNHRTGQPVTQLVSEYDIYNRGGIVEDISFVDLWAYAVAPENTGLERCIEVDPGKLILKREIYYAHALGPECPETSCDIIDVPPGLGRVREVDGTFIVLGWPRVRHVRLFDYEPLEPGFAGVYGMRHQVCAAPLGDTDLCSPWQDSGLINWRVPGRNFTPAMIQAPPQFHIPQVPFLPH